MVRVRNIAMLLTLALPATAMAQVPDLSGTWVLQADKLGRFDRAIQEYRDTCPHS